MAEAGILYEDDRVEQIDGEVVCRSPIGPKHAAAVNKMARLLIQRLGDSAFVTNRTPLRISSHSEPQPDLMLLRQRDDDYAESHAGPADVLLLIEVADTSLACDRDVKRELYAAAGVPEVWTIDLNHRKILACTEPREDGFALLRTVQNEERVVPGALPDFAVSLAELRI